MNDEATLELYFDKLWPICRSITGDGFRKSMGILSELVPWQKYQFPTGQKVLDWTVPKEWNVYDAYLIDPNGKRRAWFRENNLHLMGYSIPYRGTMPLRELRKHLYSLPDQPRAIPYLTSYYEERWGFCLSHEELLALPEGDYQIVVDTKLESGYLEFGEAVLKGETDEEILFSSYLCHPSLANNELSGPLVLSSLYRRIASWTKRRYTYRFVLVPETIGSIAFLSVHGQHLMNHLVAGYQLTCVGDGGAFTFKKSRRGDSLADRAGLAFMKQAGESNVIPFSPAVGSDERQYCSPGFNLPVASLMRTMYTCYPEYHTSLDNKNLMSFRSMADVVSAYEEIAHSIECNRHYVNLYPFGEPQLGPRGLFRAISGKERQIEELALWWLLNYADGDHDLFDIADLSGLSVSVLNRVAAHLVNAGIFREH